MKSKVHLVTSGIPLVDKGWGGMYRGGTYLLIGQKKSGRTILSLQFAKECVKKEEICLYFTSTRTQDLLIHAASIDFDLQYYIDKNLVVVVKTILPAEKFPLGSSDDMLIDYINDVIALSQQFEPQRIAIDEFTPFIEFRDTRLLKDVFIQAKDILEEMGIISLLILSDPADKQSREVTDTLANNSTGVMYLQKPVNNQPGFFTITPNIGHPEGQIRTEYYLVPKKGIEISFKKTPVANNITIPEEVIEKLIRSKSVSPRYEIKGGTLRESHKDAD